jgi:hypothetical protein
MEIAEMLPDGQRQRARGAVGLEYRRRTHLEIGDLKNLPNLVVGSEMQQCTPLHKVTVIAVPDLAQNSPLPAA